MEITKPKAGRKGGTFNHVREYNDPVHAHLVAADLERAYPENIHFVAQLRDNDTLMSLLNDTMNWDNSGHPGGGVAPSDGDVQKKVVQYYVVTTFKTRPTFQVHATFGDVRTAHTVAASLFGSSSDGIAFVIRTMTLQDDLKKFADAHIADTSDDDVSDDSAAPNVDGGSEGSGGSSL